MVTLKSLPFSENALQPYISAQTISFHYGAHHRGYVNVLNGLIQGTRFEDLSLEEIVRDSFGKEQKIFNNAAQVWNHEFYWDSLTPSGRDIRSGSLFEDAVKKTYGDQKGLVAHLVEKGMNQFGSGWCWLVSNAKGDLSVVTTGNADVVWIDGSCVPLLLLDVWEHAYYLDYQNLRKDYLAALLTYVVNWKLAEERYQDLVNGKLV